uniref:Carbonic anhydrase n=1 Tax=Kwoniella pini CBS 10737 TaxID=1296096 RepID=A0A1B9ID72_9TREE|nr:carbonic anhydrase [Kwoniella pini CBS 10737]OCF53572.1 carbonic anhydrase [Kwoniella pini CBS 10737]
MSGQSSLSYPEMNCSKGTIDGLQKFVNGIQDSSQNTILVKGQKYSGSAVCSKSYSDMYIFAYSTFLTGSDARVPETTIMGCQPGDIFVHRNIANLYSPQDDSLNAVMMIALQNFKVKHIVVTGHTNCVGCQTALNVSLLPTTKAITPLQKYVEPLATLSKTLFIDNRPPSLDLLVEENVLQQVKNLSECDLVQNDWKRRGTYGVRVHGWVYHLEDGTIRDLNCAIGPPGHVPGKRLVDTYF